jgi:putative ATPase
LFYGPPGTGKTTLARIIANQTQAHFRQVSAPSVGVKEIREVLEEARAALGGTGRRTVLFIDELHRFNRAQQDVLLSDVEDGLIILIGATTENPFFAVNSPLISRSQIFQFERLSEEDIRLLVRRALLDSERGMGRYSAQITDEAIDHLAKTSDGDARRALAAVEVAILSQLHRAGAERGDAGTGKVGPIVIDLQVAAESIQRKAIEYDPTGDAHYDAASALIKSMRGSDPDATIYWLARMLEAGEDPRFVARRIAICAAEDIGNADPMALVLANAAVQVTQFIGMPECQLVLAQAAIYLACAPKSNASAMAIWRYPNTSVTPIILGPSGLGTVKGTNMPTIIRVELWSRITWVSIKYTTALRNEGMRRRWLSTWRRFTVSNPPQVTQGNRLGEEGATQTAPGGAGLN